MQMFLLSFPLWSLLMLFVVGSGAAAAGACWWVSRRWPDRPADDGVGLAIFQTVGAVFGITLAFTISAVYGEFEVAADHVSQESNDIAILYRLAQELPASQQAALREGLQAYAEQVIELEWPLMTQGLASDQVALTLDRLWQLQRQLLVSEQPPLLVERLFHTLHDLTEHRRNRLLDSRSQLAPLMWLMLLNGGVVTVLFGACLRSGNPRSQMLMVAVLAAVIGFGLLLVMALDAPFSGSLRVPPDAIREIAERLGVTA